ncbi:unnamed protein product [Echinostoma caproni]|uniref:WD_REPEATS_REGION domain-containing protein n=1 Tax=Echinostoma caproni TaxID=27848 RepID=A0A182ZZW7_9TREM|nr:unnamed protein product [Echinostoma caproni]
MYLTTEECVAHSPGSVTSLSLGRKSGRVMATGGEDRRVKLWAVGKPTCILSLTGHTSSVEAIEFSQEEDCVAAGSLSGSIRIWDLEQVKSINSLDFHPFGNFVTSGSVDSLVKVTNSHLIFAISCHSKILSLCSMSVVLPSNPPTKHRLIVLTLQ